MTTSTTSDGGPGSEAAVRLVLQAPDAVHPVGRPVPVQVTISNAGDSEMWIVGVLDGSEEGVRYPHYRPVVMRDGVTVAEPGAAEDPLVARLRAGEVRRLAPGASFDPTRPVDGAAYVPLSTFATWACPQAGEYQYVLSLSTHSPVVESWLGRVGPAESIEHLRDLLARVPRLTITSNVLTVRVGPASA